MKYKALYCLTALFCLLGIASAQNPFGRFKFEHWDTKKGLPNDLILNVYQTSDGYLWMAGFSGLSRFDGVSFSSYSSRNEPLFKTDNLESIFWETEDSTLWIPTSSSGLLSYRKGKFTAYLQDRFSLYTVGRSTRGELIYIPNGRVGKTILLFDPRTKKYSERPMDDLPSVLAPLPGARADNWGNQWRMLKGELIRIKDGKFYYPAPEAGPNKVNMSTVYVDSRKRVWLGSDKGLYNWDGEKLVPFPGMEKMDVFSPNQSTGLIIEDDEKGIWVAAKGAVAHLPEGAQRFDIAKSTGTIPLQSPANIIKDKEGNLWISADRGLFKISKSRFVNYSEEEGLDNNRTSAVCQVDTNSFVVGARDKLYLLKNGVVQRYPTGGELIPKTGEDVFSVFQDSHKNLWVCCYKKIYKISKNGVQQFDAPNSVRQCIEDKDGKIWFAITFTGIGYINEQNKLSLLDFPKANLKERYIGHIRKLKDGTWVTTSYNKGILFIDPMGNPKEYSPIPGVSGVGVFKSWEDEKGDLWFPCNNGLARMKNGAFVYLTSKDGMPENSVFDILADKHGYIWLTSNKGLIRAKKKEMDDYCDKKTSSINWELFDDADGMRNRQCVGARFSIVADDGRLLVPTVGGLVELNPTLISRNPLPPSVVMDRVKVDDLALDLEQSVSISPGNHRYIFSYSAMSYVAPEKVKIKFRLVGYDKDWISSVGDRKAFYTNLHAGTYTFQVIAANNDGVWNKTGASFQFTVEPFFYETIWFRVLAVLAGIFIIWQIILWRTRVARQRNQWLEEQVAARTEELKRTNNEISEQKKSLETTLVQLKATQSQLVHSEKMASLGELTAGIAHEIQNPLNFVNNFSEVNRELIGDMNAEIDKGNYEEVKNIAKDISENEDKIIHHGKRADSIVKGMLQHSRSSSGQKEPTNINALCDEYLRLAYHGLRAKDKSFNAGMQTDFDGSLPAVNVLPQDLGRVVLNLITNAFYAVAEKKKTAAPEYEPMVTVATKQENGKLLIQVKDNGMGIPAAIREKIFQPFFTTKPTGKGTGLGLSMSYDIVTKGHGGELTVVSKENEYTVFTIILPLQGA
jgi:signal transduction histidine kinase/ligand-binding sensor domain-containing protein